MCCVCPYFEYGGQIKNLPVIIINFFFNKFLIFDNLSRENDQTIITL